MPPRYAYWTIILDGKPTAFRARSREELVPTLRQLQARHPDAIMMWFARGRLWSTPEEARQAAIARRRAGGEHRGPDWRPGGAHVDPRARFKVPRAEKRHRIAARLRQERGGAGGTRQPPGGKEGGPPEKKGGKPQKQRQTGAGPGWRPRSRPGRPRRGPGGGRRGGGGGRPQ